MSNTIAVRENSLNESEERYRGLFGRVPIGLFSITLKGEILDVNPTVIDIVRCPSKDELLKVNVRELLLSLKGNNSLEEIKWDFDNFETEMKTYDGAIIWVRVNCIDVEDKLVRDIKIEFSDVYM